MKKAFLALALLTQGPLGWASANGEKEIVCEADLSPASFRPSQLVPLAEFLQTQAKETKVPTYAEVFSEAAKVIEITRPKLENLYKKVPQKGGARKGPGKLEERFFLPQISQRDAVEKLVSSTILHLYQSLCFVVPDMAERMYGHGLDEVTGPLYLKHRGLFDTYGRFCNFYADMLKKMHPKSDLANGARHGALPGHKSVQLLFVQDDNDYLMVPQMPVSPVSGLASNYFVSTPKRPYMGSTLVYDGQGQIMAGCGLILTYTPDYDEIVDVGRGPEKCLFEWQVRLHAPDFYLSPLVKKFDTRCFLGGDPSLRKIISDTPLADAAMADSLFAPSVRAFLEKGDLDHNGVVDYVSLPTSPKAQRVLRLLMLEEERLALMNAQETETRIEEVGSEVSAVSPYVEAIAAVEDEIRAIEESLIEDEIRAEQEAISKRVIRDAQKVSGRPSGHRGGKNRGGTKRNQAVARVSVVASSASVPPSGPSAEMIEAARSHVEALKIEGRVKWRSLLGHVNTLISQGLVDARDVRIGGSHVVMHTQTGSPVTLVRPHGKRDAIWAHVAKDALMELVLSTQKNVLTH